MSDGSDAALDQTPLDSGDTSVDPVVDPGPLDTSSDPEPEAVADSIEQDIAPDPVDDTPDLAEECAPIRCEGSPAPIPLFQDYESVPVGQTPCAWEGLPMTEESPTAEPPVVVDTRTDYGRVLQHAEGELGAIFRFEPQADPFRLGVDFLASSEFPVGASEFICLLEESAPDCRIVFGYGRVPGGDQVIAAYGDGDDTPQPLAVIVPGNWHHFSVLIRPAEGNFDIWFDGELKGQEVPMANLAGDVIEPIGNMVYGREFVGTGINTVIDNLEIGPDFCWE